MEVLGRMLVASAELVEAEGRVLRRQLIRLVAAAALLFVAALLGLVGAGFLMYAIFMAVSWMIGPVGSAAILGIVMLLLAGGALWLMRAQVVQKQVKAEIRKPAVHNRLARAASEETNGAASQSPMSQPS